MTAPPDLALFLASLRLGGAERHAVNLASGLAAEGLRVDMVLSRAEGPLLDELPASVEVVDLGARRMAASLPHLAAYLRRRRPPALVAFVTHACLTALVANELTRRTTAAVAVEVSTPAVMAAQSPLRRDRLAPRMVRRLYPRAAAVVANSEGVATDLRRLVPVPVRVIPVAVATESLWTRAAEPVGHPWFEPGQPPVVVAAARLEPEKDLGTLLAAFASLRETHDARLLVLGEGRERPALEARVAALGVRASVDLPGFDPNPYRYLARAAAVALSSRVEGLPTVLVEALALGVPVVATDCPSGPRELLAGGRFGRLVPVGDAGALAAALRATLDGPRLPVPPAAWERYEAKQVARQYHELLRDVARPPTSRQSAS